LAIKFNFIFKEQAKWTCNCDERMINKFEKEFKESLSNYSNCTSTMDNWITWLDSSVAYYLQQYEGSDRYAKMAKQFLLKWSFLW
jgi:regulatory factor X 1/2/3